MEKKKKIWTEPKLTALVRRKPEEGILDACKMAGSGDAPQKKNIGCERKDTPCNECFTVGIT